MRLFVHNCYVSNVYMYTHTFGCSLRGNIKKKKKGWGLYIYQFLHVSDAYVYTN